jgi:outer membrane receptor protein involved in Fe transport
VPAVQNLSGRPTDFAPRLSGSVTASYGVSLPDQLKLTAEVIPYFTTDYFADSGATDDPLDLVGGYMRLDARLSLKKLDQHWTVDVVGKNLTNRTIISGRNQWDEPTKEEPSNVGIQFSYHL